MGEGYLRFCFYIHSNRYAEQVNPLLIQAQRKLIERISAHGGKCGLQPQFAAVQKETGM